MTGQPRLRLDSSGHGGYAAAPAARPAIVPDTSGASITVRGPLRHLCPFVDEADEGVVAITWTCQGSTLELHSLAKWLLTFAQERVSHEALTRAIRDDLAMLPGIAGVTVATSWNTAGLEVTVHAA